jgi:GAF domain-containing protein
MADQLAIAIENARLFEQARRDLQDIERLNRQLTGDAWRDYVGGRRSDAPAGFRAAGGAVEPMGSGEQDDGEKSLSVPLKVRGQTIGLLDIAARDGSEPDEETRQMLEAVAERVALALDSSRLSEQSQRQAAREQILGRLSAELQATTDLDVILRIAAREASRALDTPQSFVHLTMSYSQPGDQATDGEG